MLKVFEWFQLFFRASLSEYQIFGKLRFIKIIMQTIKHSICIIELIQSFSGKQVL